MRILFILRFPSQNKYLANIIREFEKKGHKAACYYFNDRMAANIEEYKKLKCEFLPGERLTAKAVRNFDVAFTGGTMNTRSLYDLISSNVYLFSYTGHVTHFERQCVTDFTFLPHSNLSFDYKRKAAYMPIGFPFVADSPNNRLLQSKKRFLYLDSGHMPFSSKGKIQIARLLLDICKNFPDYELCVKPRFLPNERMTHQNLLHIYDVIGNLTKGKFPQNMNLLEKHHSLSDLISCSDVVLSLYTTAIIDALLQDKPLITIAGYETCNDVSLSEKYVSMLEKWHDETGCVARLDEVIKHLPNGIKCKDEFLLKYLPYKDDASKRIADVVEYIHENFLVTGRIPKIGTYNYEDYKETIRSGNLTFAQLRHNRFKEAFLFPTRKLRMGVPIETNFFKVAEVADGFLIKNGLLAERNFDSFIELSNSAKDRFVVSNRTLFMNDNISQAWLFDSLHKEKKLLDIVNMDESKILCKGPYYFYLAHYHATVGDSDAALKCSVIYLQETQSYYHMQYPQDSAPCLRDAYTRVVSLYDGNNYDTISIFSIFKEMYARREHLIIRHNVRAKILDLILIISEKLNERNLTTLFMECIRLHDAISKEYDDVKKIPVQYSSKPLFVLRKLTPFMPEIFHRGLDSINKNGVKQTLMFAKMKVIKFIGKSALSKIWKRYKKISESHLSIYKKFISKHGIDAVYCYVGGSLNDVYVISSIFNSISKKNSTSKKLVFQCLPSYVQLAEMFTIETIEIHSHSQTAAIVELFMYLQNSILNVMPLHYQHNKMHVGILRNIVEFQQISNQELLRMYNSMTISESEKPQDTFNYFENIFLSNGLQKNKTVAIVPHRGQSSEIPKCFWEELVIRLKAKGYCSVTVCVSGSMQDSPITGTKLLLFQDYELFVFAELAGSVIGFDNGMFDGMNCVKIALFDGTKRLMHNHVAPNNKICSSNQDVVLFDWRADSAVEQIVDLVTFGE